MPNFQVQFPSLPTTGSQLIATYIPRTIHPLIEVYCTRSLITIQHAP